ncbi:uncharacterized protein LOC118741504 [Rhagoletis pomonella]|uniref:uncharacterized protein LOC118741504 n=1 Tax=Rhagoletis pomonella TaxID=28610 RepID=UPI001781A3E7|nr:uncharacterized protein LOC118741504 [Rhagoletis pomonella]
MVQWDECDEWTHYDCANVTDDVVNHAWSCEKCANKLKSTTAAEGVQMAVPKAVTAAQQTISSVTAKGVSSCEQLMAGKFLAGEKTGTKGKSQNMVDEEVLGNNAQKRKTNEHMCDELQSKCGSNKSKRNLRLDLMRLEEKKRAELAYVEQKYAIMKEYQGESDEEGDLCSVQEQRTIQWANSQRLRVTDGANDNIGQRDGMHNERAIFGYQPTEAALHTLTALQISSRQVVSRDLPPFSGKPDEWPLFISSFENSTRLCRFSNDENLLRLQRALKGKAYEYVSSKLMIPSLVPEIISTLKMVFGRPEHIFNNLLSKIRASPAVNVNRLDSLINLALEVKNLVATIEASGLTAHLNNPLLIQELIDKLPSQIRLQWAMFSRNEPLCTLKQFSDWLFDMAEAASSVISLTTASTDAERRKTQRVSVHREVPEHKRSVGCYFCGEDHYISKCKRFCKLNASERWEEVKKRKLCRRCLVKHDFKTCHNRKACGENGCTYMHHPLLHAEKRTGAETYEATVAVHHTRTSNVLFRIVPITIYGKNKRLNIFAFLDDGSGPTLIEESILDDLEIEGPKKELCLSWADGTTRKEVASQIINLNVSSKDKSNRKYTLVDVRSVKSLDLPCQTLHLQELLDKYKHLRGCPLESYYDVVPKLIIGVNNKNLSIPLKYREGKANEPAATKTRLGWAIYGNLDRSPLPSHHQLHICECSDDASLQGLMLDAIRLDQDPLEGKDLMPAELTGKVTRDGERFIAKLLWKREDVVMPRNYDMALPRLKCFEGKLLKSAEQRCETIKHIKQMETKGYIRKLSEEEATNFGPRTWYLPMFTVRNPNKPGKLRVVWDAAAKYEGVSLNDQLDKGPDLIVSLPGVLYNFRIGKIGICGDISEMFHQVGVSKSDQNAQRFLWRDCDPIRKPDTYVLQVLRFGASCSPSLALYAKNKNAKEFEHKFPAATRCIIERHYVDDMLDSTNTVEDAIKLAKDVRAIHAHGGFRIRNWLSNSPDLLLALGEGSTNENFCKAGRTLEHVIEADKIQESTDIGNWNYVPTKLNVADLATKWSRSPEFSKEFAWFTGLSFLKLPKDDWPNQNVISSESLQVCNEEVELQKVAVTIQKSAVIDANRFSKWERLLRLMTGSTS